MKRSFGKVYLFSLAIILAILLVFLPTAALSAEYTYTTIDIPGSSYIFGSGINDSNEIVGWYGDPGVHSFMYSGGIFTPIVFLTDTWAFGINNSGDIVGYGIDWWYHNFLYSGGIFTTLDVPGSTTNWGAKGISNSGDIVGAYGDDLGRHGFLYSGGQFTQIDVPGAVEWTTPTGINNSGDIVGIYTNRDEPSKHRGFLISGGIFITIDVPGATGTDVNGINDYGDIVGRFYDANRGFLYSRGIFTTIHVPGAEWTGASGINNFGCIVGTYGDATGYHGFIATPVPQPPQAICQDVIVAAGSDCTATASIDNGSYDPNGDSITSTQSPSGPYSLGDTTVTLTVIDSEGASSKCTGTVTVVDKTPPAITSASVTPSVLWPPNHKMVNVTVDYNVTDDCGQPTCQISNVTSNEPISSSDYTIVNPHHVKLVAEREGKGTGRVYTIAITCEDTVGNPASQTATVTVPHDQGKK